MKYGAILILTICLACSSEKNEPGITIIPQPESVKETGGVFKFKSEPTIYCSDSMASSLISVFSGQVKDYFSIKRADRGPSDIEITIEQRENPERYSLQVNKRKILIAAGSLHGAFNGLQTLRQLIIFSQQKNGKLTIQCCSINDAPKYSWRGLMLDESRHFFGEEKVKQLLDIMSLHKLNIFHWHLTDVPGWRIEIRQYPKLTEIGGTGNQNDPEAPAKYYTQEQIREIVKYAGERYIQIVPEIDMPGHAGASNRAYPEYSGGGSKAYPEFTFNPGKEETYSYLTDILKEVVELFPSPYIHLGGDEVDFGNQQWNTNKQVRMLMKNNNLPDLKAVEKYFIKRMADTIKSLNKTAIGWDEIIDSNISPEDAIVMWWRHDKPDQLKSALQNNYKVVLCPRIPLYFDFVQYKTHKWGRRWRGKFCDLETVYNFPPDTLPGLKEYSNQILGMQANIWTEVIQNNKRLDFMTYPRLSAMAEAAWTVNEIKNYDSFLERLKPLLNYLKGRGIYYFDPFNPEQTPEPPGPGK